MKRTLLILSTLGLSSALVLACGDKDDDSGGGDDTGHDHTDHGGEDSGSTSGVDGAAVFAETCANCHGDDGTSGSAPDLSVAVPAMSDDELRTLIEDGQNYMPAQDLESDEIDAVIAFLRDSFPG